MCGCARPNPACFHCLRAGGPRTCPSFVSPQLEATLRENREAIEVMASLMQGVGASLTASFVLSPVGVPLVVGATAMQVIANGCDTAEVMKSAARGAARGCKAMSLCLAVAGVLLSIPAIALFVAGPAGLAALAADVLVMGTAVLAFEAAAAIFDALGAGGTPSQSAVLKLAVALAALRGIDLTPYVGTLDKLAQSSAEFQDAVSKNKRRPLMPSADDVNLQLFARATMTHIKNGVGSQALERFFGASRVQATDGKATGGASSTVGFIINNVWLDWRKAHYPTTADAMLTILRKHLASRAWFPAIVAEFGTRSGSGTVGPKPDPLADSVNRIRGPGANVPPPPPSEGGGIGGLVFAGVAAKLLGFF